MTSTVKTRVGLGYDFHAFEEGRQLFLGGVPIPHPRGLRGHSDADALLHAVADALLGAAGLKDIGTYFPDTDPLYAGYSSLLLLEEVFGLVLRKGFKPVNLDIVVIAEEPKLQPHVETIKANLARVLQLETGDVGVKATTMEGRGTVGRREGIAVQAVVLIQGVDSA